MKKPHIIIDELAKRICNGKITLQEFEAFVCPWCGINNLDIKFSSDGKAFSITEKGKSHCFFKSYEIKTPPEWWKSRITELWLD